MNNRITPAHAGKTRRGGSKEPRGADHPRACGENEVVLCSELCLIGSPPRMRGKQSRLRSRARRSRITPAHAGKTNFTALTK